MYPNSPHAAVSSAGGRGGKGRYIFAFIVLRFPYKLAPAPTGEWGTMETGDLSADIAIWGHWGIPSSGELPLNPRGMRE